MTRLTGSAAPLLLAALAALLTNPAAGHADTDLSLHNQPEGSSSIPGSPLAWEGEAPDWVIVRDTAAGTTALQLRDPADTIEAPNRVGEYRVFWGDGEVPDLPTPGATGPAPGYVRSPALEELQSAAAGSAGLVLVHPDTPEDPYFTLRREAGRPLPRRLDDDYYHVLTPGAPTSTDEFITGGLPFQTELTTIYGGLAGWELDRETLSFEFGLPEDRLRGGELEVRVLGTGERPPRLTVNNRLISLGPRRGSGFSLEEFTGSTEQFLYDEDNELSVESEEFWVHRIEVRLER